MKALLQLKKTIWICSTAALLLASCGAGETPVEKEAPVEKKVEQVQKKPGMEHFYQVNPGESQIHWTAKKVTADHTGTIEMKTGKLSYNDGLIDKAKFIIDMKSIVCTDIEDEGYNEKFIDHLFSDDFFSVNKYPFALYEIGASRRLKDGTVQAIGQLKIKGKEVKQQMIMKLTPSGNKIRMEGEMEIDRTAFGIRYGSGKFFDNLGDKMIDDTFTLKFDLQLVGLK